MEEDIKIAILSPQSGDYYQQSNTTFDIIADIVCPDDAKWTVRGINSSGVVFNISTGLGPVRGQAIGTTYSSRFGAGTAVIEVEVSAGERSAIERSSINVAKIAPKVRLDPLTLENRWLRFRTEICGTITAGDCPIESVHWTVTLLNKEGETFVLGSGSGQPVDGVFCELDPRSLPSSPANVLTVTAIDAAGLVGTNTLNFGMDGHPPVVTQVDFVVDGVTVKWCIHGSDELWPNPVAGASRLPMRKTGGGYCNTWSGIRFMAYSDTDEWYVFRVIDLAGNVTEPGIFHVVVKDATLRAQYYPGITEIPEE